MGWKRFRLTREQIAAGQLFEIMDEVVSALRQIGKAELRQWWQREVEGRAPWDGSTVSGALPS